MYTRSKTLPQELVPELKAQAEAAGIKWESMALTDNTCPPHPPPRSLVKVGSLCGCGVWRVCGRGGARAQGLQNTP